jgi:hypothetical protein
MFPRRNLNSAKKVIRSLDSLFFAVDTKSTDIADSFSVTLASGRLSQLRVIQSTRAYAPLLGNTTRVLPYSPNA